ncbi:uncharacterized protein PHACADRAFT_94757 [Phanerochaete carnosa HHB-10118-sp]|uniref:Uncharacterized protein n=1 Tax=Phanerochaete carnosa (strain HHB-10118-sp) TaxID=650164 RepID=K5WX07_PHACS|nr:uncharacterized protein PHACADRAFT_94757 [Phanerochaete carnosa HHB-10118-sp]EKM55012.1 hypothetical protein PHACADRAFT_94757 [Phanerochaete carnosa HHB-10118-sp]
MDTLAAQSASTVDTSSWYPSPTFRGTWQIISTCISTLIICIWNATHIDIPPNRQMRTFPEKVRWLIAGLLAPDWLLLRAFDQLCSARQLSKFAGDCLEVEQMMAAPTWRDRLWRCVGRGPRNKLSSRLSEFSAEFEQIVQWAEEELESRKVGDADADSAAMQFGFLPRKNAWTLTHGYYAAMGGFVLDSSPTPVFGTETRLVLTPWMLDFLMKRAPNLIPDLSEDDILCQSKSDGLAKALLVVQLLYFAVSCIARLAQSLPLSLLEVWTLAHALGTIFVYAIWWKKPLNISKPTVITGMRAREFAAYFQMIGTPSISRLTGIWSATGTAEMDYLEIIPYQYVEDSGIVSYEGQETLTMLPTQSMLVSEDYAFSIKANMAPDSKNRNMFGKTFCPWYTKERGSNGSITLGRADIVRWRLAGCAAAQVDGFPQPESSARYTKIGGLETTRPFSLSSRSRESIIQITLVTTYALPHILGWNAAFPTPVEHALWRLASVMAVAFPTAIVGVSVIANNAPPDAAHGRAISHMLRPLAVFTNAILGSLSIILYILSNVYFLVESLRQLYYLPDDVSLLPNLSIYFPHFS